jgi:Putative Ig domain
MTTFHLAKAGIRAVLPLLLLAMAPLAQAHHTAIDFGLDNTPPSNNTQGEAWEFSNTQCTSATAPATCMLDFNAVTNSGAVGVGFNVNINGTKYAQVFVNKNGIVTFVTGLGAFAAATDFTDLTNNVAGATNPFIAAFYPSSELSIPSSTSPEQLGDLGGAEYGRGTANPAGTDGGTPTDLSHNVAAFKATWAENEGTDSNGNPLVTNPIITRIVLYNTSATGADGDFDIRLEYGLAAGTVYNGGSGKNGIVGFRLGSDTDEQIVSSSASVPTLVSSDTDYYYHFCGGHLSATACTVTPPPPPLTLACPAATARVGAAYSSAFSAAGGVPPYTFSDTGVPAGLALNATTGALTGTPSAAGAVPFTAKVVDSSSLAAGTVTASCTITVSPAASKLRVTPLSLAFGTVERFSLLFKTVTLTNTGTAPVSLSRASISSGNAHGDFAALSLCGSSLAAGKSCPIYVVLFALDLGSLSATLNIPNNAAGSPQTVPLSVTVQPR